MIKMGEITCRIPSNGIKPEILYCTEPEGMRLDIWGVGIDLSMAVLTAFLFIIAALALGTAKGTLKRMQIDGDRQWDTINEQISEQDRIARDAAKANRELAREQHQTELLVTHVMAIRNLQMLTRDPNSDLVVGLSDLSISWATWSMYLHGRHSVLLQLTQNYLDSMSAASQLVHDQIKKFYGGEITEDGLGPIVQKLGDLTGNYIGNLTVWQASEEQRQEKERNIRINLYEMNRFYGMPTQKEQANG